MGIHARRNQRRRESSGPPPRINPGPVSAVVNGTSVSLQGTMTTTEPVTFDGLNISIAEDNDPSFPWKYSIAISNGATVNGVRTLSGTQNGLIDGKKYVAYVSYSLDGQSTWTTGPKVRFTIGAPPTPVVPTAPEAYLVSATLSSLAFAWKIPTESGGTIISYTVSVLDSSGQLLPGYPQTITDTNNRMHEITGLSPATNYTFKVTARNNVGDSPDSNLVSQATTSITSGSSATPSAPTVTIINVTTSTINISWAPPSQHNGTISGYRVGWDAPAGQPVPSWSDVYSATSMSLNLTNLVPDHIYSIWVEAINENGTGERYTVVQRAAGASSGGSVLANPQVGTYMNLWQNWPIFATNATNIRLAFIHDNPNGVVTIAGYTSEGKAALVSKINQWRAEGRKVILSIGGKDYSISLANPWQKAQEVKAIIDNLGVVIDGIDYDLEDASRLPTAQQHVAFAQQMRNIYGPDFMITVVPGGGTINSYYPIGQALNNAGLLTEFGQQYYEGKALSLSAIIGRVNQAKGLGIPAEKISIGMMFGGNNTYWTMQQCIDFMTILKNDHDINKCYLWHAGRLDWQTWEANMRSIVGL